MSVPQSRVSSATTTVVSILRHACSNKAISYVLARLWAIAHLSALASPLYPYTQKKNTTS